MTLILNHFSFANTQHNFLIKPKRRARMRFIPMKQQNKVLHSPKSCRN